MLNESHLFLVLSGFVAGLVYYANFYLSHLSYLAFPTLQVCICSLCFSVPTFISHTTVTGPFQHFRCVSTVFVFLYPLLPLTLHLLAFATLQVCICSLCFSVPTFTSHTSPTGLCNTSGVYLQSLFFCTYLYLSHLTNWPFQHFRHVLCWCSVKWFLYLQVVLHAISSIPFSVNDGDLAWLVQVDREWGVRLPMDMASVYHCSLNTTELKW